MCSLFTLLNITGLILQTVTFMSIGFVGGGLQDQTSDFNTIVSVILLNVHPLIVLSLTRQDQQISQS